MTLPRGITRSLGPTYTVLLYSFDLCSNCHSYSLASICPYTLLWITVQMNLPYAHLRYLLEGYRPSQTNTVTRSEFEKVFFPEIREWHPFSEWYFTDAPNFFGAPTYSTQKDGHTQCNHSVKVYGVFSSTSQLTVSSLLFQFH